MHCPARVPHPCRGSECPRCLPSGCPCHTSRAPWCPDSALRGSSTSGHCRLLNSRGCSVVQFPKWTTAEASQSFYDSICWHANLRFTIENNEQSSELQQDKVAWRQSFLSLWLSITILVRWHLYKISMSGLVMIWWHKQPGHLQAWLWPSFPEIFQRV